MATLQMTTAVLGFLIFGLVVGFIFGYSDMWRNKLSPLFDKIVNELYELYNENNKTCPKHSPQNCCIKSEENSQSNCDYNHDNVFEKSLNNESLESSRGNKGKNNFCSDENKENKCCCCKCNCALGKYRKIEKRDIEKIIEKIVTGK